MTQEQMRSICWEIGTKYPVPYHGAYITLATIHPRSGFLQWNLPEKAVQKLHAEKGDAFHGATLAVRVYDVTAIDFNGFNAHRFFDIHVQGLKGKYYLNIDQLERNLMAEIGFRLRDNSFHALARSNTVFFDRDRPSGQYQTDALFVGRGFRPIFPVDNVFDAQVYERMHQEMLNVEKQGPLNLAVVFLGRSLSAGGQLETLINHVTDRCKTFGGNIFTYAPADGEASPLESNDILDALETFSDKQFDKLKRKHAKTPFDIVHCHDWYSSKVGISAAQKLNIPFVLSLHSTEYERAQGSIMSDLSKNICEWEKDAIQAAASVIVPHSSTRQQILSVYNAQPEKVVIISDMFEDTQRGGFPDPGEAKKSIGLNPGWPMAMFAGEISHAAGADLLVDAILHVSGRHGESQFAFVGEGPLKGEMEGRIWHAGLGHRCKFVGDLPKERFELVLMASDFVIIPARTWQDEGLAQMAISFGKPVLTTHQAHINCITHGQNGLVTYDNPGSIIWGVNEMLANPLQGNMFRIIAKKNANQSQSLESVAVEYYVVYANILQQN